jgi:simple sugar transport system substrate-binding protein
MKVSKIGVVAIAASALVLTGCSSSKSGTSSTAAADDNAKYNICMVTHGDGGGFWSVAKAGAERAAKDLGVTFKYEETNNDAEKQAQLIQADTTSGCQAIAASAPNPDAIKDAMLAAKTAGIPTVTMNSGSKSFKDLGAFTHIGQDEFVAGQGAGEKFKAAGVKHVLCVIQEANNIGLQQRCDGAKDTFGNVTNLQLSAGLADLATSQAEIKAKLQADPSIDALFLLNADIAAGPAMAATAELGKTLMLGTVDLSGPAVQAIADGKIAFAIDQQQYAQGYLSVVLLYLDLMNGNEVGGGLPVNTGPGFVTKDNAARVQALAAAGTR